MIVLTVFVLHTFVISMKRHGDSKFIVINNDRVMWQQM